MQQFENSLVSYDVVIDYLSQKLKGDNIAGPEDNTILMDAYLGKYRFLIFFSTFFFKAKQVLMLLCRDLVNLFTIMIKY
jgi:hypothetical protein